MLPRAFDIFLRIAGFLITAILLLQPWLLTTEAVDPFMYTGWIPVVAGFLSLFAGAVILAFYRPKKGFETIGSALFILFIALGISLYYSKFSVSLRSTTMSVGLLACLGTLRFSRKSSDNIGIAGAIAFSGFIMAIYAISQYLGYDFFVWGGKPRIVGTLANPNFLGIYLCMTSVVSFGLFTELFKKSKTHSLGFLGIFLIQVLVLYMLKKAGIYLCMGFSAFVWIFSGFIKSPGKFSKRSPFWFGLLLASALLLSQYLVYRSTSSYPWEKLTNVPYDMQTIVSRLVLWQMGFEIFLNHPLTGLGPGAISYFMPLQRPSTGSTLGLKMFNDDPHSFIVNTLAETGFLGLLGLCVMLVAIFGCFSRKNTRVFFHGNSDENEFDISNDDGLNSEADNDGTEKKSESTSEVETKEGTEEKTELNSVEAKDQTSTTKSSRFDNDVEIGWLQTATAILIVYLGYKSNFIKFVHLPIAVWLLILLFGGFIIALNTRNAKYLKNCTHLHRATFTAIIAFAFYSLFNNSFSVAPLLGILTLITSLHFSCCQPDVRWKPRITFVSLFYLMLPVVFAFTAYNFQIAYEKEQINLRNGTYNMEEGKWEDAEDNFASVISLNPQCLKAYHGLALALDAQKKTDEAKDILTRLDELAPNAFNAKYEIARILFEDNNILEAHRFAVKNLKWAQDAVSYELLGKILLIEGRQKEAEGVLKDGLIASPSNTAERLAADRIRLSLGALAANSGNYAESRKYVDAITSDVSKDVDAMYLRGSIFADEKKYEEALAVFEEALRLYPHIPRIVNATGYLLMITNKDFDRAQVLLESAYSTICEVEKPDLSDLLMIANSLGKLYLKKNKMKQAEELLKLSYENTPEEWTNLRQQRLNDLNEFYELQKKE